MTPPVYARNNMKDAPMRLPIAFATLALVTVALATALPAFAAAPAPISLALRDAAMPIETTPIETVQYRQTTRQRRAARSYRGGYRAYAAAPRGYRRTPWGHCVTGVDRGTRSAFPSWDLC
jgi:hypothetical protein